MAETKPDEQVKAVAHINGTDLSDAQIVALRSSDIDTTESIEVGAKSGEHVKVFVLPPGPKPTEANGFDHSANKAATRSYAISQGLRLTTDEVRVVSTKPFGPDGKSWAITYAVAAVPAERADYPHPGESPAVTDAQTDEAGYVHTNTDGAGDSDNTDPEGAEPGDSQQPAE